uniref:Uncharacterized protein n=1 Tax=Romanomermis culicivorax TaxID=13658 RepID=A0A915KD55_ROMCU
MKSQLTSKRTLNISCCQIVCVTTEIIFSSKTLDGYKALPFH